MIYTYDEKTGTISRKDGFDDHGIATETYWSCYMGRDAIPEVMNMVQINPDISSEQLQRFAVICLEGRNDDLRHLVKEVCR